jgi:hypothetical protein
MQKLAVGPLAELLPPSLLAMWEHVRAAVFN